MRKRSHEALADGGGLEVVLSSFCGGHIDTEGYFVARAHFGDRSDFDRAPVGTRAKDSDRGRIREELGVGEKEILVGYIGRFSSEKNIFSLVNAFISTTNSHPLIKLVLVGSGQQECEIKRIINKSNI